MSGDPNADLFARIEGLIGEEHALLLIPAKDRKEQERDRLRLLTEELDRIWEQLLERARRLGQDTPTMGGGSTRP
jgi:hypothetical protein